MKLSMLLANETVYIGKYIDTDEFFGEAWCLHIEDG
jgi:hypothetical protein